MEDAVIDFVISFSKKHLGGFLSDIYLFGSRARGSAREDSDYDFYVLVEDSIPREYLTSQSKWVELYTLLDMTRSKENLPSIDWMVSTKGYFLKQQNDKESFSAKVALEGKKVYQNEEQE